MKVLVTGASGFLGRHLLEKLRSRGAEVTALTRADGDLSDRAAAERVLGTWQGDALVNLAAPVTGGTEDLAAGMAAALVHARIALNVRRFARARVVHASSMTVYGLPQTLPVGETHPRVPMHLYGMGKVLAEDVLDTAVILRFGGLFAPERRAGALFHFCRAACDGAPLRVTTPTPTPWEILHVVDAAEAIARAAMLPDVPVGPMNIGYGERIELVATARRIAELGGKHSVVEAAVAHPPFQLDIARARSHLAWEPPPLAARLAELYAAFVS